MFWPLDEQFKGRLLAPLLLMLALLAGEACAGDANGMQQVSDLRICGGGNDRFASAILVIGIGSKFEQ